MPCTSCSASTGVVAIPAHFMEDMPKLAEMAERPDAVDVIVAAGMLMLAEEVQRLRVLNHAAKEYDHPQPEAETTSAE